MKEARHKRTCSMIPFTGNSEQDCSGRKSLSVRVEVTAWGMKKPMWGKCSPSWLGYMSLLLCRHIIHQLKRRATRALQLSWWSQVLLRSVIWSAVLDPTEWGLKLNSFSWMTTMGCLFSAGPPKVFPLGEERGWLLVPSSSSNGQSVRSQSQRPL